MSVYALPQTSGAALLRLRAGCRPAAENISCHNGVLVETHLDLSVRELQRRELVARCEHLHLSRGQARACAAAALQNLKQQALDCVVLSLPEGWDFAEVGSL